MGSKKKEKAQISLYKKARRQIKRSPYLGTFLLLYVIALLVVVYSMIMTQQQNAISSISFAASSQPSFINGFSGTTKLSNSDITLMNQLDATWIREGVEISGWNGIYTNATNANIKVLAIIGKDALNNNNSFGMGYWNYTVARVAHAYPKVSAWEILNEPQLTANYMGYWDGSAAHYYNMLRAAYIIIKSINPDAEIVGFGGLSVYGASQNTNSIKLLNNVDALGGANYYDAISIHAYPFTSNSYTVSGYQNGLSFYTAIASSENKPLWVTEIAVQSSLTNQSNFIKTVYPILKSDNITRVFWFTLRDQGTGGGYGLAYPNTTPKNAFYLYSQYAPGAPVATSTTTTTTVPTTVTTTAATTIPTTTIKTTTTTAPTTTVKATTTTIKSTSTAVTTTVAATTTTNNGGGGGGGGGSGGGGGGGSMRPLVNKSGSSCYNITNIAALNPFNVTFGNQKINVTDNFITPTTSGVTVDDLPYTLELGTNVLLISQNATMELVNISYIPIEQTVAMRICSNSANAIITTTILPENSTTSENTTSVPSTSITTFTTTEVSTTIMSNTATGSQNSNSLSFAGIASAVTTPIGIVIIIILITIAILVLYLFRFRRKSLPPQEIS